MVAIVSTTARARAPVERPDALRLLLLSTGRDATRLRTELAATDVELELTSVESVAAARAALVRDDWAAVIAEWPLHGAAEALQDVPSSVPRILVVERLGDEALRASQRFGTFLCTIDGCAAQLRSLLVHVAKSVVVQLERHERDEFEAEQVRILERVAAGAPLPVVLERVVRLIEWQGHGLCSVLLLESSTGQMHHAAAPSLPSGFIEAIDGQHIGPAAGSCGVAAYTGEAVFVRDIASHPYWRDFRDAALSFGLRACWSTPILSSEREVLGTFAVYYEDPRDPSQEELRRVASATHLASIAIERQRHETALRLSEQRYRQLIETSHEGVLMLDLDGVVTFANERAAIMLARRPEELIGLGVLALVPPTENGRVQQVLQRRRAGISEQYELQMRAGDGRELWAIVAASPIIDGAGRVVGMLKMLTDISERRRAEQALARSELELRSIFENTPIGVALLDAQAHPMRCNAALGSILGFEQEELREISLFSRVYPEDLKLARVKQKELDSGELIAAQVVVRLVRKDGSMIWTRVNSSRLRPGLPDFIGVTVIEDITESKRLEDAIRDEQRLRALIYDSISEVISYIAVEPDETYRFVSVNPAFSRWFDMSTNEVVGKRIEDVLGVVPLDSVRARYREAIEKRSTVRWDEVGYFPTGTEYAESAVTPVFDASGVCTHLIVTSRVVTERKRAEAKITEQAALLERARDAIVLCSLDHVIRFWNASAERIYGYSSHEAVGRSIKELLYPDASDFENAERELLEQGAFSGELRQSAKDGREVVVDSSWTLLRDRAGRPESVLAIHTDATEKKKLQAQVMLAQRMESLGTLAGGIAHDFNNILAAIRGYLELAMQNLASESPASEFLEVVRTATDRAVELVQQILTFSRRRPAQREPCRLQPVVDEVLRLLRATLPRMIHIEARYEPGEFEVMADVTQIHQILMNLGTNAAQALGSHGTVSVRLAPVMLRERLVGVAGEVPAGAYMRLSVSDDGSGMDAETLGRIFDPFFTTKAPGMGTGLGLSVVLGLVKDHGGALRVQSAAGQGTTFDIYLPAAGPSRSTSRPPAAPPVLRGDGELILCVDDEASLLALEATFLEGLGYRVEHHTSAVEALAAFQAKPTLYAALVTDLAMAEMSGIELAVEVHALSPQLPVVLCSGYVRADQHDEARKAGVSVILPKPDVLEPLAQALARMLHKNPALS